MRIFCTAAFALVVFSSAFMPKVDGNRTAQAATFPLLHPGNGTQTKSAVIGVPQSECKLVFTLHKNFRGRRCTATVTATLRDKAKPVLAGTLPMTGPGVRTESASITICFSGPSLGGRSDCLPAVQHCKVAKMGKHVPSCDPSWTAGISAIYQYNGHAAQRLWVDTSLIAGFGFIVLHTKQKSLKGPVAGKTVSVGEKVTVRSGITNLAAGIQTFHLGLVLHADGTVSIRAG